MPEEITPNVVIANPRTRLRLGVGLYLLSVLAGVAALFFAFFPEASMGTDIPMRAIAFTNGLVSLLSGAFGLIVTAPNIPKV